MANLKNTSINDTGFFKLPAGDTAARPASPAARQLRFNTDTGQLEQFRPGLGEWIAPSNTGIIATGGTVYDVDVEGTTYRVHVFTNTGNSTFTVSQGGEVEYLIVAGGGSGGGAGTSVSGGGGAGGLLQGFITIETGLIPVTVGAGGAPVATSSFNGNNGNNSVFGLLTAVGGGGGSRFADNGLNGGSGGGAGSDRGRDNFGGQGVEGQGNDGGRSFQGSRNQDSTAGGGGGAGEKGKDAINLTSSGDGGDGLQSAISGTFTFYAGGGGGSGHNFPSGAGGLGGGGGGGQSGAGIDSQPNTGGGGGGGCGNELSGGGGSGIVVIRYPLRQENPVQAEGKVAGDGLVLDLDFAKPTVHSGLGTVVNDSRLNGISGTLVNSPVFTDPRTHRSSFRFNGSNQTITGTGLPFSGNQQSFSFSIWARAFSRSGTFDGIFTLGGNSSNNDYEGGLVLTFSRNNSTLRIRYWQDGGTNRTWTNTDFINGNWFNFTVVVENKNIKVYENNVVRVDAGFSNNWSLTGNYRIAQYPFSTNYLNGDVATVSVYNRALSGIEVSQYYNATRWRFGV